jgi:hypothetical protein
MHWCLRYETLRERKSDDAADEAGATKEEEVPVEATGLFEGILASLSRKGGYVLAEGQYSSMRIG